MKLGLFALLLVVAGACAMPSSSDVVVVDSSNQSAPSIIIDDIIRRLIEFISKGIKKVGLDPLEIKKVEVKIPRKPFIVNLKAYIEGLKYVGASNIKINSLDYSVLFSKLTFDISLPQLSLTIDDSGVEVSAFKHKVDAQLNGSLITESISLSGEISVSITPFSLRSVSMNFSLGDIKSDLKITALGRNFSNFINTLLNKIIPNALKEYGTLINKALEDIVKGIFFLIHIIFKNFN